MLNNKRIIMCDFSNLTNLKKLVDKCLKLELKGEVPELQNCLFQLYSQFNKPGASIQIVNYPEKINLALCFAFMLHYDWMHDSDIREVWSENGFYCIQEYLDHQPDGQQGQVEGMIILFTLLCVGRDSLVTKIQDLLNKAEFSPHSYIFHNDDYKIGAQNVIDQISLVSVSGIREMGKAVIPVMMNIITKYDGLKFFQETIMRKDLMKYDVMDVIAKMRFIRDVIKSILVDA